MVMISVDYMQSTWSALLYVHDHYDLYRLQDQEEETEHLRDWSTLHQQRGKASRGARQSCAQWQ